MVGMEVRSWPDESIRIVDKYYCVTSLNVETFWKESFLNGIRYLMGFLRGHYWILVLMVIGMG